MRKLPNVSPMAIRVCGGSKVGASNTSFGRLSVRLIAVELMHSTRRDSLRGSGALVLGVAATGLADQNPAQPGRGAVAQAGCGTPVGAVVELMAQSATGVCQTEHGSALLAGGLWSIIPSDGEDRSRPLRPRLGHLDHGDRCTGSGNGFRVLLHVGDLPFGVRREDHLAH